MLGYRRNKDTKEIYIVSEEAETVKKIFQMYLQGRSLDQIKRYLEENNILTVRGNSVWDKGVIKSMLTNEKYVGDVMFQKTYREDCISKRTKINRGEMDRYLVTDNHPAIIDRETFRMAKKEMVKRSSKRRTSSKAITELGKYSGKYAHSELLFCDVCGSPFRRKTWTRKGVKKVYWRCLNHVENGDKACPQSRGIEEGVLHEAICRGMSKCIPETGDVQTLVKTMLAYATSEDEVLLECQTLENAIRELQGKANEEEEMCIRTEGNKEPYMEQIKKYYSSIAELRARITEIKKQLEESDEFQTEMQQIDSWLENEEILFAEYDDDIVRHLIDSIRVTDDLKLIINVKGGVSVTEELYQKED